MVKVRLYHCLSLLHFPGRRIGWDTKEGESHLEAMLRGQILTALVDFGDEPTLKEASRRFDAFLDDRSTHLLPPDIRRVLQSHAFSVALYLFKSYSL